MTPIEYFDGLDRLIRTGDESAIMAFEREHLTDDLLTAMTPQERRSAASVTHVAARALGGGSLGPPTGIPVDDDDDELVDAVADDSAAPARVR